jgi:hypothetical protein
MSMVTPAQAMWNQRATLAAREARFRAMIDAVGMPGDMSLSQWATLFTYALEFRPDLILELGRGRGNSTCCFLEAASVLRSARRPCRVVSLCLDDDWQTHTAPRLRALGIPRGWFAAGDILVGDLLQYDPGPALEGANRCLVFWDAHGFDIAEWVLGNLLPRLQGKTHAVLMHDLSDVRYCGMRTDRGYGAGGVWKGERGDGEYFWLGHIGARVPQAISAVDFTARNRLPLHSADESLHEELGKDADKLAQMRALLPPDLFSLEAHWFYFSPNEATGPVHYPRWAPRPAPQPAPRPAPAPAPQAAAPAPQAAPAPLPCAAAAWTAPTRPGLVRRALRGLARRVRHAVFDRKAG